MKWSYEYTFHNAVKGYFYRWVRLRLPVSAAVGCIAFGASLWINGVTRLELWLGFIAVGMVVWLTLDYVFDILLFKYRTVRSYRMTGSTTIHFTYARGKVIVEIGKEQYSFALSDFSLLAIFDGMIVLRRKRIFINNKVALWFKNNTERDALYNLIQKWYAKNGA